ncbi:ABC transporter substrate-binding protein [Arvimicrobium flavum]|uniref:ABC transporter substrate-binding protein n=1 Tax=Arvimicrobium flavum TaxID=3393320 RepID=UPI00237C42F4|nr:extracellular solute-binding protein [Mesorhizobium shangrilense]
MTNKAGAMRRFLAGCAAGLALCLGSLQAGAAELRILTWEGLADDAWIKPFEEEHGVTVKRTYVGSNDEYMAALAAGNSGYDTVVIVSSLAETAINAGFVEALDLSKLPNFSNIYSEFANVAFLKSGDKQFGVPTFWDIQPITFNTDVVKECSFDLLFDPQYKARIAMWDDVSTLGDVATYLGIENIWTMTDEELARVKAKMLEQKPLIRRYWSTGGEIIELFTSGEVVATNSWSYVTQALKAEGVAASQCAPKNPNGWVDSHFIVKGSRNMDLAHEFLNYMLRPDVLAQLQQKSGFGVTVPAIKDHLPAGALQGTIMESDTEFRNSIRFWEEIPERGKYLEVFNEIKAAAAE